MCRLSSAGEQRFCKPKVGGSIPSAGTIPAKYIMRYTDLFEAAPPFVKEKFGRWDITAARKPNPQGKYDAIAKDRSNPNISQKTQADSMAAAIANLKELLSNPNFPTTKNTPVALNFNVEFTREILSKYEEPYWFTIERTNDGLSLIMAGEYYKSESEIIKTLGYTQAYQRLSTDITDLGATQAWAANIPINISRALNLFVNGRYTIDNPVTDDEGNHKFKLTFHSLAASASDKKRLGEPALTIIPRK
jgi:hypothetical protein